MSDEKMYSASEVASLLRGSLTGWGLAALLFCALPSSYIFFAIPRFESLFKGFGADLPVVTMVLLHWRYILWVLPVLLLALIGAAYSRTPQRAIETHNLSVTVIGGVCCPSMLLQGAAIYALYAPIFRLGAVV